MSSEIVEEPGIHPIRQEFQEWIAARQGEHPAPVARKIPGYIEEEQFAAQIGVEVQTVRKWRRRHYGPQAVSFGRRVYYKENAAREHLDVLMAKVEEGARDKPRRGRPRRRA